MRAQSRRLLFLALLLLLVAGCAVAIAYALANSLFVLGVGASVAAGFLSHRAMLVARTWRRLRPFTLTAREYAEYRERRG